MASGRSRSTCWFLETGEDRCIYLIREAKRIGKVAAVRLIKETTERPALIGVCLTLILAIVNLIESDGIICAHRELTIPDS
jgi:hypothetical protein